MYKDYRDMQSYLCYFELYASSDIRVTSCKFHPLPIVHSFIYFGFCSLTFLSWGISYNKCFGIHNGDTAEKA
jgi:hypothetical protein